jgi:hypothetical protein
MKNHNPIAEKEQAPLARETRPGVSLHIERLILDGVEIATGQQHSLQAAVEGELTKLLIQDGLAHQSIAGGMLPRIVAPAIQFDAGNDPAAMGRRIAGAVFVGIRHGGTGR